MNPPDDKIHDDTLYAEPVDQLNNEYDHIEGIINHLCQAFHYHEAYDSGIETPRSSAASAASVSDSASESEGEHSSRASLNHPPPLPSRLHSEFEHNLKFGDLLRSGLAETASLVNERLTIVQHCHSRAESLKQLMAEQADIKASPSGQPELTKQTRQTRQGKHKAAQAATFDLRDALGVDFLFGSLHQQSILRCQPHSRAEAFYAKIASYIDSPQAHLREAANAFKQFFEQGAFAQLSNMPGPYACVTLFLAPLLTTTEAMTATRLCQSSVLTLNPSMRIHHG